MNLFTDYIKEQAKNINENDGILIVVDVQKEFEKWIPQGLVESINKYCEKFTDVYQIFDSNKADKPSWTFPNQKGCYVKKYGTTFSPDLVDISKNLDKQYPDAKEGDRFVFTDTKSVLIRVKNKHRWFYINKEMCKLFKSLKGKRVVVLGGADFECLKDIYEGLESFGVIPMYNHDYIYSAETSNQQTVYSR